MAGRFAAAERLGLNLQPPPPTTAHGALLAHITGGHLSADGEGAARSFQPMNVNFGLFPPVTVPPRSRDEEPRRMGRRASKALGRKRAQAGRALADFDQWLSGPASVAAE